MSHGTRRSYRRGCACVPCKAAECRYRADLRKLKQHGKQPLGARISAKETWQRIRKLLLERYQKQQIARALGLKRPILELHTDRITVRNALKIQRFYRLQLRDEGAANEPRIGRHAGS